MPLERGVSMIDVTDRVLDKGIVIDYWSRVFLFGIDILTRIEGRVVVSSIDTYLKYAGQIGKTGTLARRLSEGVDLTRNR
jgi:hypothetical protein